MHLTTEEALDWVENRMDQDRRGFWSVHVGQCGNCERDLAAWGSISVMLRGEHLMSAPEVVVRRAAAAFAQPQSVWRKAARVVAAALVFDSFSDAALAGARGSVSARQIVLEAPEVDVHLRIWTDQEVRRLAGQILPRDSDGFLPSAKVHLLRGDERLGSASTDSFGEFQISDVPEGSVSLQIDLVHITVVSALDI